MRRSNDKKLILRMSIKFLCGIFTAIAIISIATVISLNLKFIYKFIIERYNLVNATGVSAENLIINYNGLIDYLQNPFIHKLTFPNFDMSTYGEIHFYEVKRIFISIIGIGLIFILSNIIYIIICKVKNKKEYGVSIIRNLNLGANILVVFFVTLIAAYIIDFSKAFILFHKLFFKNDYWIFDASIDPIINALPEDLFMIYGAIILIIIIVIASIIKVINKRNASKSIL